MMPPAILLKAPCSARPMATPTEAIAAITEDIGTPRSAIMDTASTTYKAAFTNVVIYDAAVVSMDFMDFILPRAFITFLIIKLPTI